MLRQIRYNKEGYFWADTYEGVNVVLLGKDALHFVRIGDDAFFATNFTREELEALPAFDRSTVMQ